jgi:membrane associated rhomboid family serine protease
VTDAVTVADVNGNDRQSSHEAVRLNSDVTFLLLVLNVVLFVYTWRLGIVRPRAALEFDARYALSLAGLQSGGWWQFLTYQFLHGGWIHLITNVLFLHSLGPVLETTLGWRRFLTLYLVSGAIGGLVQLLGARISPQTFNAPVVGASASLCGLLAALGAIYAEERIRGLLFFLIPFRVRAKFLLLIAALLSVIGAVLPTRWLGNIAHLAHLGGLLGGLWCVNWMDAKPTLTIAEGEPPPPAEPSSSG